MNNNVSDNSTDEDDGNSNDNDNDNSNDSDNDCDNDTDNSNDSDKDNDAYIATAVVFMPILAAGIKGNQEEAAQLALYKGQLNAIRQAAIMKDCEIIVQ